MSANGQRCWDYLSHRLKEINQLRSEDDEQEPILVSKLNCLQVGGTRVYLVASAISIDGLVGTTAATVTLLVCAEREAQM
jgi:hypothetical protein